MVRSNHVYVHRVFVFSYLDWSNINLRFVSKWMPLAANN